MLVSLLGSRNCQGSFKEYYAFTLHYLPISFLYRNPERIVIQRTAASLIRLFLFSLKGCRT